MNRHSPIEFLETQLTLIDNLTLGSPIQCAAYQIKKEIWQTMDDISSVKEKTINIERQITEIEKGQKSMESKISTILKLLKLLRENQSQFVDVELNDNNITEDERE